mmetsp:Transcript_8944/g.25980  ORF Transcript_8944/g.25980 Transcript_8944/m.25980 type:complete len:331 (-) Transcript_8944:8-1000(-)
MNRVVGQLHRCLIGNAGCSRSPARPSHTTRYMSAVNYVRAPEIVMGCVAYCPEITGIWDGMKSYFQSAGLNFDYVLYSSYEAQNDALINGRIDIAWNGPLAHVRLEKLTKQKSIPLGMRDVDRNFQSIIVGRSDRGVNALKDLSGKTIATGSFDSPQAYILPLLHLKEKGVPINTLSVLRFDRDIGKHGDTALGEIDAIEAVQSGKADAALVSNMMWMRAISAGDVNPEEHKLTVLPEAPPPFDHCQFDCLPSLAAAKRDAFTKALFAMDWANEEHRRVMQMEGLRNKWEGPREPGYDAMRRALADEPATPYPAPLHTPSSHPFKALVLG